MKALMRAGADPRFEHVYAVMASQMAKTTGVFNVAGERLDDDPVPVLYIGPTKSNVMTVIEPKLDEMLRLTPSLWSKTIQGKKYTRVRKVIGGVTLRLAWAGSPTELASDPAGLVIVDEVDRMEDDIKGEGNIIELADARHSSYADGRTIATSSPTEGNVDTYVHQATGIEHWLRAEPENVRSAIWLLWQDASAHEWSWPCPDCRTYFVPRFKLLVWESGATAAVARRTARLACPNCGVEIRSRHKPWMNARGVFVMPGQRPLDYKDGDECAYLADFTGAKPPALKRGGKGVTPVEFGCFELTAEAADIADVSFWTSGIANFGPKKTFGYIAARHVSAVRAGSQERIKGVITTGLGECFKFAGDAPEWHAVLACAEDYESGTVPEGVVFLVCTVDVQKDRLVYAVRGHGLAEESWLIEAGELWGRTGGPGTEEDPGAWEQLEELAKQEWDGLSILRGLIDSGYRKDQVYAFCRRHRGTWFPTKGQDSSTRPYWSSPQDVNHRGRVIKGGVLLWNFDADLFKQWVHARVEWPEDQPGGWHIPKDISEAYCRQIVGEQRITLPSGNVTWKVVGPNHWLDCEALQPLAVRTLGKNAAEMIARKRKRESAKADQDPGAMPVRKRRSKGSNFVNKW